MIAEAIPPDHATSITRAQIRQRYQGPIVRIVNVLWSHPKGLDLVGLWKAVNRPELEDEFISGFHLLIRAGIVTRSSGSTFRISDMARKRMR